MYEQFGNFVDGEWVRSGRTLEVMSPVSEKLLGKVWAASPEDTQRAIDAASAALGLLSELGGFGRADALHHAADNMIAKANDAASIISDETGKPIEQSAREWNLACDQFRWYAEEARRIYGRTVASRIPGGQFEISRHPVGVVGAFTAWNFPAALPARKLAPALAAGCPVVLRPSSQTPGVAMILMDCLRKAGLPKGSVNLVVGSTIDTYEPIMNDARVRKVSLTGSTGVGQQMLRDAANTVKKVSMELGGNAPFIVFEDADLELALNTSVAAKFANCGQVCVAPDRFFVHERLYEKFVEGFVGRAAQIKLGDGRNPGVDMGPLINKRNLERIDKTVQSALAHGAKTALGGKRAAEFNSGHFYEPTVLINISEEMDVFASENFGPVAAITSFTSDEDVFRRANDSSMGLSAYTFTTSPLRARQAIATLNAGMVGINSFALAASEAPFGGTNFSGMGREGGSEGIEDYLDTRLAQIVF